MQKCDVFGLSARSNPLPPLNPHRLCFKQPYGAHYDEELKVKVTRQANLLLCWGRLSVCKMLTFSLDGVSMYSFITKYILNQAVCTVKY